MAKLAENFRSQSVDGALLLEVDDEILLEDFAVSSKLQRKRILLNITTLKEAKPVQSAAPSIQPQAISRPGRKGAVLTGTLKYVAPEEVLAKMAKGAQAVYQEFPPFQHLLSPNPASEQERWRNSQIPCLWRLARARSLPEGAPVNIDVRDELAAWWEVRIRTKGAVATANSSVAGAKKALALAPTLDNKRKRGETQAALVRARESMLKAHNMATVA